MRILLVEDDVLLSAALTTVLEANHYTIDRAEDGQVGLDLAAVVEYDLILLDAQLPKLDGIRLCRQLRSQGYHKPILLIIADDSDSDAIAGFDAGADDYISKPCLPGVLLARIRTLLRRSGALATQNPLQNSSTTLTWGALCLDWSAGRVTLDGHVIALTATEYNLLELFLRNPDRIFSRNAILDKLWGLAEAPSDRAIITYVKDVRKKLKAGGLTEDIIETVYGMGYRLKPALPPQPPAVHASAPTSAEESQVRASHQSAIDQVLDRFQGVFEQQVALLAQATTALLAGHLTPDLHQAAKQEAHKLAGSLASFGYPNGSTLARSIEHLLISPAIGSLLHDGAPDRALSAGKISRADLTRLAELVAALQQELTNPPEASSGLSNLSVAAASGVAGLSHHVLPHHVLVVDDDAALTDRLIAEADAWGLCLNVAPTLDAARSRLMRCTPDVVLLDLSFPATKEDGLSFLQEIMQQMPGLPVIVFTGRDSLADRLTVSRLGARRFLHKPANTEQIFQAIVRVLPQPQAATAKVLIVDDDSAMLAVLSRMLTPWGLEIVTLREPQHFWNVLVTTAPDLILLDLEMPQVSGLDLCQVVRQDAEWGDLPILVVTAHADAEALQKAFAAGADDFIAKPVLGPELVTRVLSRMERHRLHQGMETMRNKTMRNKTMCNKTMRHKTGRTQ